MNYNEEGQVCGSEGLGILGGEGGGEIQKYLIWEDFREIRLEQYQLHIQVGSLELNLSNISLTMLIRKNSTLK